jgi:hypothetical protein
MKKRAALIAFGAVVLIVLLRLMWYHAQLITSPIPLEYREGGVLLMTKLLLAGGNPYAWANQPLYTNIYGVVYAIVVLPFAALFGSTAMLHRIITGVFIIGCSALVFWALRIRKVSRLYAAAGAVMLYGLFLYYSIPVARPDSLGSFLFLAAIIIPYAKKYSTPALAVGIILGVLAFLTKPYFVFALLFMSIYLYLSVSRKKAVIFTAVWGVAISLIVVILPAFLDAFLVDNVLISMGITHNSYRHLAAQLAYFSFYHAGIILLALLAILMHRPKLSTGKEMKKVKGIFKGSWHTAPFRQLDLFLFCAISSTVIVLLMIGKHQGSWLAYLFQLISPFIIIFVLSVVLSAKMRHLRHPSVVPALVALNLLLIAFVLLPTSGAFDQENMENWRLLEAAVDEHEHILNSPAIAPLLMEQGKQVYDSGQSEYFASGTTSNPLILLISDTNEMVVRRSREYNERMTSAVRNKEFDALILTEGHSPFVPDDVINENYVLQQTVYVEFPANLDGWDITIMVPR